MKKKAFTLAEVLITLGIIGVVAALVMPGLIANYQKRQYVTQLQKVYSELAQAAKHLMADEGVDKLTDTDMLYVGENDAHSSESAEFAKQFLYKYFKVAQDCGYSNSKGNCFAKSYKTINNTVQNAMESSYPGYCVQTAGGASICMWPGNDYSIAWGIIDINGAKGPNIAGRDLFSFSLYYDGSIDDNVTPECRNGGACPGGDVERTREYRSQTCLEIGLYGAGCLGKILSDGWKMDY